MPRRTKIVTTLGPATDREGILEGIIRAGADMVRMNFSHGTAEDHILRANQVRDIAAKLGRHVAIMGDLQGPKIRVSTFKDGKIQKIMGTADGPEWAANSAASKEATTWLATNRVDEWKKVTDEKGGLIRNAETAPEIIRLLREYGKAKSP